MEDIEKKIEEIIKEEILKRQEWLSKNRIQDWNEDDTLHISRFSYNLALKTALSEAAEKATATNGANPFNNAAHVNKRSITDLYHDLKIK